MSASKKLTPGPSLVQDTLEELPYVERAHVHVDWEKSHAVPEHCGGAAAVAGRR